MAQEPVYDFEHKLVSGITVKWQLNPIGLQVKNKPVPSEPILRSDSVLWQLERYDWMFSHNIVFLRIQLLRTVYDYWTEVDRYRAIGRLPPDEWYNAELDRFTDADSQNLLDVMISV